MHPALSRTDHRPWPLPARRWSWRQSWCDLCFVHWPVDADSLQHLVPRELALDTYEGRAFIGVVPFRMEGVSRRPLPDLPGLSAFPEINVRTYVRFGSKAGVWFLSLDATNAPAVWAARRWFGLPYHRARIQLSERDGWIRYTARRKSGAASFEASYTPRGTVTESETGTLEHFLTERYCLFAGGFERPLSRADVHHQPWPLQPGAARIAENTMLEPLGLEQPVSEPLVHFARRLDVVVWSPVPAASDLD